MPYDYLVISSNVFLSNFYYRKFSRNYILNYKTEGSCNRMFILSVPSFPERSDSRNWKEIKGMCRNYFMIMSLLIVVMLSCKKEKDIGPGDRPTGQQVFLKDIIIRNLPSPYYHFSYNEAGDITQASVAAGTRNYTVAYS